jgi:hypothetical protein
MLGADNKKLRLSSEKAGPYAVNMASLTAVL